MTYLLPIYKIENSNHQIIESDKDSVQKAWIYQEDYYIITHIMVNHQYHLKYILSKPKDISYDTIRQEI